jgi:phosphoadenosine phosphosulfate reductase
MSQQLSFTGQTLLDESLAVLRQFEPPEGYWLAFSGGKDSVVLHELALRSSVKFDAHYNVTTVDPPELVRFIRRHYPQVAWERPKHTMYRLIETRGFPTRNARWCCADLKERGGTGRVVLTGIRQAESPARKRRGVVEKCRRHPSKVLVSPVLRWSNAEVWSFIRGEGLAYCPLYDEGWKRLGCVPCPFERRVACSMARWPGIWEQCRRAFHRRWACETAAIHRRWRSADEAFAWWCSRDTPYPQPLDEADPCLFGAGMEEP